MKVLKILERSRNFWYLLGLTFVFFLFRLPSLFEPNWYGDEGVYQVLGDAIRSGRLLYRDIWDNKPPLLYTLYAILGSDQFAVRLASLIFGVISIFLFYKICKKIFEKPKPSLVITTFFTVLLALPVLEGNIANAENFMLVPTLLSALMILKIKNGDTKKIQNKNLLVIFISGLALGISFLFKIVALFDFAAFLVFMALFSDRKVLEHIMNGKYTFEVKKILSFILGFSILPLLTAGFFILKGAFSEFITATFFSNIGYVGYGNKFIVPQGLLIIKLALLGSLIAFLYSKRNSVNLNIIFVLIWFSFSLFNAFFSQRPYTHYLLVLLSSISLLIGLCFYENKWRAANLLLLIIFSLLIFKNFTFYGKVIYYYQNYISFVTNRETVMQYQRFFDRETPVDYELAAFIKTNTKQNESIFTWGNNAQLYKLTNNLPPGRYTVAYHITGSKNGVEETTKALANKKPKIIVIMPGINFFPFSLSNYYQRVIIENALVYERVF